LIGTVAANVTQSGTGAINVDGCRIGITDGASMARHNKPGANGWKNSSGGPNHAALHGEPQGRWPANVVLSHHEDCVQVGTKRVKGTNPSNDRRTDAQGYQGGWRRGDEPRPGYTDPDGTETVAAWDCHPDCPVAMLDAQSGERGGGFGKRGQLNGGATKWVFDGHGQTVGYGDRGGPSRFFYTAKASRSERNAGLEGMPERNQGQRYGTVQDARPHTPEGYEYPRSATANHHPTVKPIALMRWLVRLITPPGGVVLDPFMGSGSTGCAVALEGFQFIGIEQDAEYAAIAERRISYWRTRRPVAVQPVLNLETAAD
jgi:site-specific DNA-methyltransferase (adenine-specific)